MRKKLGILAIVLQFYLLLTSATAQAAEPWSPPQSPVVGNQLIYLSVRDEYLLNYYDWDTAANRSKLNYWTSTGVYYELWSNNVPNGHWYLTCNGTYIIEVYQDSMKVGETAQVQTTKIQNPACQSYDNADQLKNDLNIRGTDRADGSTDLSWDFVVGADHYDIYKDGIKITQQTGVTSWHITDDGTYTFVAVDSNGQSLGQSDYIKNDSTPNGGENNSDCDACQWLSDALACPDWDTYMGDLTGAIKNALPPPPNWEDIADTFVGKFADYFGDVPVPPSVPEIENNVRPNIPAVDTNVPQASIAPAVPSDFNNGPLDTDITQGEQIEVEDDSQPIEIYDPDKYIDSDGVGEFVYPGDERNSSNGIKQPDTIDTPYEMPIPADSGGEDIPPADMPVPNGSSSSIPIPDGTTGIIPIPQKDLGN
jgi:hypothetical protein